MHDVSSPWWRGAVIYQVYVRSFADADGDGHGDLAGLLSKLDYITSLGVDGVWLSPVHPSPNRDWGYDVSDYETIHPDYGTQSDFDRLLNQAHARGLRVMLDEVLAHTSDEHCWFRGSLGRGDTDDWYVWAPPREDGTAPNNWLSAFGGPAWSYHPGRREYYHHKFLRQQPKLNWRNAAAREAALTVLDRWLERGVDGFRLDVANAYLHDAALRDNPAVPLANRTAWHWAHAPNLQYHIFDSNLEDNIQVLDAIRRRVERYPERFVMGEFSEEPERCGCFLPPNMGLHSGYSFPLLVADTLGPGFICDHFAMLAKYPEHWPSIAFSNHDVARTPTRFGGPDASPHLARLMLAILLTLKGTALLYQGEELGLPEAELPRNQLRDPVGDLYYPVNKGRDGCRTPMPWDAREANLGFTTGTPWLPPAEAHRPLAVSEQEVEPGSTLNFTRALIGVRRARPALRLGQVEFLPAVAPVLAFRRIHGRDEVLCVFNMGGKEACFSDARISSAKPLVISPQVALSSTSLTLPEYGIAVLAF